MPKLFTNEEDLTRAKKSVLRVINDAADVALHLPLNFYDNDFCLTLPSQLLSDARLPHVKTCVTLWELYISIH